MAVPATSHLVQSQLGAIRLVRGRMRHRLEAITPEQEVRRWRRGSAKLDSPRGLR